MGNAVSPDSNKSRDDVVESGSSDKEEIKRLGQCIVSLRLKLSHAMRQIAAYKRMLK